MSVLANIPYKSPLVWGIGAFVVVLALIVRSRSNVNSTQDTSARDAQALQLANANAERNVQIAQINADVDKSSIGAQLGAYEASLNYGQNIHGIDAQRDVALTSLGNDLKLGMTKINSDSETNRLKINADKTVQLTGLDYSYKLGTTKLAYDNQIGLGELDVQRGKISSDKEVALDANTKAIQIAKIHGDSTVAAVKAAKRSGWDNFLGSLGGGLGNGLSALLAGI